MRALRIPDIRSAIPVLVLGLLVTGVTSPAAAGDRDPQVFEAYHDDQVVHVMMGPGGNSENPNQRGKPSADACGWGLGPDYSDTGRDASRLPKMYVLFVPGADQMPCPPPNADRTHDMVLEAVPGERGYNASVHLLACRTTPGNTVAMPLTSATAVIAEVEDGRLSCVSRGIGSSPVVAR